MTVRLGVNVDHVATLRNARGGAHPDPFDAAVAAVAAGADGITMHLREDRRHVRDADLQRGEFMSIASAFHDQVGSDGAVLAYLRRLLIDDGPAAAAIFGSMYAATVASLVDLESAGVLRPTQDAAARAAFLLINDLAVVLLRDQLTRVLGVDPLSRAGLRRWGNTVMEIYRSGAFAVPDESPGGGSDRTD